MAGILESLLIIASVEIIPELPIGAPFSIYPAMFNPDSFTIDDKLNYNCPQAPGSTGSELQFRNIEPRTFSFDFIVDGTGASGDKREVVADIALFKYTCGFVGTIHRPTFLTIVWGTFISKCILTEMSVKYTLFRSNGTPLRATITAKFKEFQKNTVQQLLDLISSPDLTHVRKVKDGDTLPLLANQIYNDPKYYMELAKVNKLNNFRQLKTGSDIIFPPVEKAV